MGKKRNVTLLVSLAAILVALGQDSASTALHVNPFQQKPLPPLKAYSFVVMRVGNTGTVVERRKGSAQSYSENLENNVSLDMVALPQGSYYMGLPNEDRDRVEAETRRTNASYDVRDEVNRIEFELPPHLVKVQTFYIGKFEVTQAQWRAVAKLPRVSRDLPTDPSYFKGDSRPVEQLTWEDMVEFCLRLSRLTGRTYRLPSEAEWEYACRANTATPFNYGETITPQLVNYNSGFPYRGAAKGVYKKQTTPVGSFPPNAFGLYDMHGSVAEWCLDQISPAHSYGDTPTDGRAFGVPEFRNQDPMFRGGDGTIALVSVVQPREQIDTAAVTAMRT